MTSNNDKRQKENTVGKCTNHISLHMWWVICIMSVVILALLGLVYVVKMEDTENKIINYVSFVSTLLSIVLSVFAIIYSYTSALEASRQWADVNKAVEVIKESTQNIKENNQTLLQTVISIKGDVKAIGNNSIASNKQNKILTTGLPSNTQADDASFNSETSS